MAKHGFRNTTGSPIVIGALSIAAGATFVFYDEDEGTLAYVEDIEQDKASNPTGVCSRLASGTLVYTLDSVDQTASDFFAFWSTFYGYIAIPSFTQPTKVTAGKISTSKKFDPAQLVFRVNNGASVLAVGRKTKAALVIPYACEIFGWVITSDVSGSIEIDIYKGTNYAIPTTGSICGTQLPSMTSATSASSSTLNTWTRSLNVGDVLVIDVKSVTSVKSLVLALKLKRT